MPKYLGSQIESVLFTHFVINRENGNVVEKFGWTNTGIDSISDAIKTGIEYAIDHAARWRVWNNRQASAIRSFKFRRMTPDEKNRAKMHDQNAVLFAKRLGDLQNLRAMFKTHSWKTASDVQTYIKMARKYIGVDLLDRNAEYDVSPVLVRWNDHEKNRFYHVEADYSISEWRLAVMSYDNNADGSISLHHKLFRGPSYEGFGKSVKIFDESQGIRTEDGDRYFASREQAVSLGKERIAQEQNRLQNLIDELDQKEVA